MCRFINQNKYPRIKFIIIISAQTRKCWYKQTRPLSLCFADTLLPLPPIFNLGSCTVSPEDCNLHISVIMIVKVVASLLAVFLAVESLDLVGAPADADINSPEVQDALRFAVAQYNAESKSIYTSQVVKVISVQTQVRYFIRYSNLQR